MTATEQVGVVSSEVGAIEGDLELRGLVKRYSGTTVVDSLDLTIPSGQLFALLGPSGCGKTTTLRMVAGLEQPDEGSILLSGNDITQLRGFRRPVNTVFQSYALFPHLTIFENVAFGLRERRASDIKRKVERILETVELSALAQRKPAQLSGGQQQRVALARAIVNEPQVLLLDEPLGALDMKLRRQMQYEVKQIQSDLGLTFLHVTHDQEEAMTMADKIAVMNGGRIEQMGAPEELYESPRTAFVANFLGNSNLLPGIVLGHESELAMIDVAGQRVRVPSARVHATDQSVFVGVRPEKIRIARDHDVAAAGENELAGIVLDSSYTGIGTEYVVEVAGSNETVKAFVQNDSVRERLAPGTSVRLIWQLGFTFALDGSQDPHAGEGTAVGADTQHVAAVGARGRAARRKRR
ncbi:ABC transporter ATP-binding protein [Ruicaihuangia caeni]|uniref:ABC transporter ATP-binding protein n=1 Tax=Ruicaihuangia caeni TaxID=3042517 RepID=UPI003390391C